MKKVVLLTSVLFFMLFGISGIAGATYIQTVDVYEYSVGGEIVWNHAYGFSEPLPISFVTLAIVADDVDGPGNGLNGESDGVFLNGTYLGDLTQLAGYTNFNYSPGAGNPTQDLTTTIFNIDPLLLDFSMPITVSIETAWGVEIETSTLTVQGAPVPEPATMLLLGSGLVGLAAFRQRFK